MKPEQFAGRERAVRCDVHQRQSCWTFQTFALVRPTGGSGPLRTLVTTLICCNAARLCGHSCTAQHFLGLKRQCADIAAVRCARQNPIAVAAPWMRLDGLAALRTWQLKHLVMRRIRPHHRRSVLRLSARSGPEWLCGRKTRVLCKNNNMPFQLM